MESPHVELKHNTRFTLSRIRRSFSVIWIILLVALIVAFITARRSELEDLGSVVASADPRWIAVVGCLEAVILILMAKTYQTILVSLGHRLRLHTILSAYLRGLAVGTVIPFGGPAAVIVFTRSLARRNVPINDAVYASALASISGFASFLVMMGAVLGALYLTGDLPWILVTATLVLAGLFIAGFGAIALLLKWGNPPAWIARRSPNVISRFVRQARSHHLSAADLRRPLLLSIGVDLCGGAMLYAALLSVGQRSGIVAAFAAYQVEMLFNVITPLFQGIGIADLSITVALNSLDIPLSSAATATLVYRLWDLWVPLVLGFGVHLAGRQHVAHRLH